MAWLVLYNDTVRTVVASNIVAPAELVSDSQSNVSRLQVRAYQTEHSSGCRFLPFQHMTENSEMQRMTPLASLIYPLQEIAREELPPPRTCRVKLWDDGDYDIVIYHSPGQDEMESISYDVNTGDVTWEYRKSGEWVVDEDAEDGEGYGTPYVQEFEESETRRITTIDPPVGPY